MSSVEKLCDTFPASMTDLYSVTLRRYGLKSEVGAMSLVEKLCDAFPVSMTGLDSVTLRRYG